MIQARDFDQADEICEELIALKKKVPYPLHYPDMGECSVDSL